MVAGEVQGLEVVIVVLDLRPFGHREAQPREDGDDLVVDDRERVQRSLSRTASRQREVELGPRAVLAALGLSGLAQPALDERLQLALGFIGGGPHAGPLALGQAAQRAEQRGERALAPQITHPDLLQLGRRPSAGDRRAGLVRDGIDARVGHYASRLWLW